jgi:NAD(P)-dependent dehydrogenase (short-subunit alcohol dehydrogenase family)
MTASGSKVALVTNATTRAGTVVASGLARRGFTVIVGPRQSPSARELDGQWAEAGALAREIVKSGGTAVPCRFDLSTDDGARNAVESATKTFGALDLLVACSAFEGERALSKIEAESWRRGHDAYLTSTFLSCQAAARWMIDAGHPGHITCLTGVEGLRAREFGAIHQASVAGAVCGLVRSLALELRHKKVSVNAVALGAAHRAGERPTDGGDPESDRELSTLVPLLGFLTEKPEITGLVICLDGRRLSLLRTVETVGALPPEEGWTSEAITQRWAELSR